MTLGLSVLQDEHALRIYPNWMVMYFDSLTKKEDLKLIITLQAPKVYIAVDIGEGWLIEGFM